MTILADTVHRAFHLVRSGQAPHVPMEQMEALVEKSTRTEFFEPHELLLVERVLGAAPDTL